MPPVELMRMHNFFASQKMHMRDYIMQFLRNS